jgi:hypothetical protein
MSENPGIVRLAAGELVRKSEKRATSMSLPVVVHHRLDALAELAEPLGASRAEIIGMLISTTDFDAERLEADIVAYRRMTVGRLLPPDTGAPTSPEDDKVVELPMRRPGRPPRNAAS